MIDNGSHKMASVIASVIKKLKLCDLQRKQSLLVC